MTNRIPIPSSMIDILRRDNPTEITNKKLIYSDGWKLIHHAAKYGALEVLKVLINEGDEKTTTDAKKNILHIAAEFGKEDIIKYALDCEHRCLREEDINKLDSNNKIPLFYAVHKSNSGTVKLLISSGSIVCKEILEEAEKQKKEEIIELLRNELFVRAKGEQAKKYIEKEKDVDVNYQDKKGNTILHNAVLHDDLNLVRYLVKKEEINKSKKNKEGKEAIHIAIEKGNKDIVDSLLQNGVDVNAADGEGRTLLYYAIINKKKELFDLLINKNGIVLDREDNNGKTPLQYAVENNNEKFFQKLIANGVQITALNIEQSDSTGHSTFTDAEDKKRIIDKMLGEALVNAVKHDNGEEVEELINKEANVNYVTQHNNSKKWTPLHYASDLNHAKSAKKLIDNESIKINAKDSDGNEPLHIAAKKGNKDIIDLLLKKEKGVVNNKGQNDWTALHYAAKDNYLKIVEFLIKEDADINVVDRDNKTPLQIAREQGNQDIVQLLLTNLVKEGNCKKVKQYDVDGGVSINHLDREGWSLLHHAANRKEEDLACIVSLVEKGADINVAAHNKDKPIHIASSRGHQKIVKFFLDEEQDVNERGNNKWTPLHYAVDNNSERLVKFLIEKEADIYAEDYNGITPLKLAGKKEEVKVKLLGKALIDAVKENDRNKVEEYINKGADIYYWYEEDKKWTPLHYAASLGLELAGMPIVNKDVAVIKVKDRKGSNPLHIAAAYGKENMVEFLLEKDAKLIEIQGKNNWTPLHYAADQNQLEIVKLLIETGAKIDSVSSSDETPLQLAIDRGNKEVARLLRSRALFNTLKNDFNVELDKIKRYFDNEVDVNYLSSSTPLHEAVNKGYLNIVKFLIEEEGANINARNVSGEKPLHLAAKLGHKDIVKFFLDKEQDVNERGNNKWTPLHHAVNIGNKSFVEFLIKKGADIYAEDYENITPLKLAEDKEVKDLLLCKALIDSINGNDIRKVREYIRQGAKIDYIYEGSNPLHIAAADGRKNIVEFLLKEDAKLIESQGKNNWTPLHYAADQNQLEIVKLLIETGAKIDSVSSSDETPLQLAIDRGRKEVAKLLRSRALFNTLLHDFNVELDKIERYFDNEVDVNYLSSSTPLHEAVKNNHLNIVQFLVEKGANINARNVNGEKPLHLAAKLGHKDIVEFFIDVKKQNVNDRDKNKWTALHHAVKNSHFNVVQYLIDEKGANIHIKNSEKKTSLQIAEDEKDKDILSILLGEALIDAVKQDNGEEVEELINNKKANVNYVTKYNNSKKWTPLHYASDLNHAKSAKKLIDNGSIEINAKDSDGNEPLHIAAKNGHKDIVDLLLKKGVVNNKGQNDWTAFHYAAEGGHLGVMESLIEKDADFNLKNSDGKIPLQLAMEKGNQDIVQSVLNKGNFNSIKVIGAVKEGNCEKVEKYIDGGVSINHLDREGWSLLHHAANRKEEDLACIVFLVEKGTDINVAAHNKDKPIHIASSRGHQKIVKFFLDKEQDVNERGNNKWTPLHHAVNIGNKSFVEFLIKKGADIYAEDYENITPLKLAEDKEVKDLLLCKALIDSINGSDIRKVRQYILQGAKIDCIYEGSNPLHIAAAYGKENIVEFLLEKDVKIIESQGKNNWTPLHYAADQNQLGIVKLLIEKGAKIDSVSSSNETPLQLAIDRGNKEVARLLRSRALFNTLKKPDFNGELDKIEHYFKKEVDVNYLSSSTPLHEAVNGGYLNIVKFLIKEGANINARNVSGEKPLHLAAKLGHKDIVEFFIDVKKQNVNDRDKNKWTALHHAVKNSHFNVVQYLIDEKGANIHIKNSEKKTSLQIAEDKEMQGDEAIRSTLQDEAIIDAQDKDGCTPLHYASQEGHIKIVKFLVEKGANINSQNSQGKAPVDLSSEPEVIQFLLNEGLFNAVKQNKAIEVKNYLNKEVKGEKSYVDYKDQNNGTPLQHAALHGYFSIVNDLVQSRADVNTNDLNNWRALHYASRGGHLNVVEFLTENNANINAKNSEGDEPLHIAAKNGHQAIVKFFINEKGMDVNSKGKNNWTPLHYASNEGHVKIVRFLIDEADADITVQNIQEKVPLELASKNKEILRLLQNKELFNAVKQGEYNRIQKYLDDGADYNGLGENNWTLLHYAAKKGYLSITILLVEKGVNINAENSDGDKPIHIASRYGHISIVKLLLNGKKVDDKGRNNKTPLHYAAEGDHIEVVRYLVEEKGANINSEDSNNIKPIHIAAKNGNTDILKFFLDKRLSVNDLGKDSWTPLHYAAEQDKLEVVKLLIERGADINARNSDGKTPLELTKNQEIRGLLLNKALFDAVKQGSIKAFNDGLSSGASINSANKWGWGTLHAAAARDNLPLIRYLVEEKGANINARNRDGEKPLHIATEKGSLEILQYFLSRKNNIDDRGKNNWTPLHYAAKYNYPKIVEFLIKEGAEVNVVDHDNRTPLQLATEEHIKVLLRNEVLSRAVKLGNDSEVINYINDGADVNYSDENNYTLLHDASSKGYINIVKTLIANGAGISSRDFNDNKPLHVAADYGHKSVVELFLEKGLSVNDKGKNNWTPLHYAASRGGLALVELLVKKRADINAQDLNRNKAIHVAAENGHRSIIEFFLSRYEGELNINDKGNNDWTMLHYAADKGYSEVIKFLIEKGADIDAKDADNRTPLQLASGKNHQEEARLLRNKALSNAVKQGDLSKVELYLADGADPNYKDENNWTALHDAASKGYIEIVRLLKERKANVDARSYEAKPLHYAARNGHKNVLELLINESNVNDRGRNNWTPLHYASRYGRLEVIEFLLQKKADINLKDTDKNKPLHIAAKYGYANVVELLLKEDSIRIDDKGSSGKTALHYAAENGQASVVEFLIENGANINIQDSEENVPLQLASESEVIKLLRDKALFDAVKQGNIDEVKVYISISGVNVTNKRGWGILHLAAADGNLSIIKFLVDSKGADINIKNNNNERPLHIAVKNGRVDVVEFFIKKGISVNSLGKSNWTPLHYASEGDYPELVRFLIREGANVNARNSNDETPLQLAEEKNHLEITELLLNEELLYAVKQNNIQKVKKNLSKGANVNYSDQIIGWTLLHYAARANLLKLTKILVGEGGDVNLGPYNTRPLHIASQYGHKDIVDFLLCKGSHINDPGWNSWMPLHYAAEKGHLDVVRLLVEKEADINAQDFNSKTPLELATENGHTKVVKVLSNAGLFYAIGRKDLRRVEHYFHIGADVNARDDNGFIPLHKAALAGDLEIVRFLLNKSAINVNARNNKKNISTLHEAAKGGNLEIVKLLISYGANIYDQDANGAKPIHIAAEYGHRDIVEFFLDNNLSISSRDKMGQSLLHYAAKSGNLETIELLINRGANINAKDSNDLEPLHIATQHGKQNIVEYFIVEKQSDISEKDKDHRTLIHYAAESGNLNIIKFLVDRGADVNTDDINNISPLHIAAEFGHEDIVEFFLKAGLNVNYQDKGDKTPLHYAAIGGNLEVTKLLIAKGANINAQDINNAKPFHIAAQYGHKDIVEFYIVQKQLNVNEQGKDSWIPLHYAIKGKNDLTHKYVDENNLLEVIKFLLRQDSNLINVRDAYGANPLHIASRFGHQILVEFFVQKGLNINEIDDNKLTPLHYAAQHGHLEVTKFLVKEGADIRSINRHGKKPIHSAAKNVHKNVVLFFVEKGLSINDPDKHKRWTPLHYATDSGNLDFVQTLLAEGADFNAIDVESAKPLHIAAESGYTAIVDLFIEKGLSVDDMGKYNWTPLHYAASRGHLDSVRSLIEKSKANINTKDSRGDKPIHIAAEYGYKDVIKFLLNKGSRVNDLGTSGWTPLHYAASRGHLDTVKFLVEEARADINFLSINYENPINIAIETKHEKVAEYLTQTQEKENMLHIRHMHSKIRHKRSIDQPQSSGASKQSSLIGDSIAWVRNWISGLFLQPEEVVSNTEQSRSSDWFPSSSDANQNTSFNHQTVTSIIQEKFKNINSEDMMFYYMLYSWFHGNKCKIKQKVCVNDIVLERDAIACALRVGKKFEFVVKRAANSSGISYESVRPDFVDIQKTITKKVMSGDYNTISEFLDSYIQEACPKDLNQRQVNNFKRAYNNEKIRTLNNELYGEVSTHNGPRLQSVFDKGQTNLSDISQISTPYCHVQQLKKHNIAISLAGNK